MNIEQVNISSSALSSSSQMYNQDLLTPSYEMTLSPITKSDPTFITSSRRMFYDYDHNENRSSVEEINQEIENLVLNGLSSATFIERPTPEGHIAPVAKLLSCKCRRRFKTQSHNNLVESELDSSPNHCGSYESGESSSDEQSRTQSPSFPDNTTDLTMDELSPKINQFLTLEPPVGCEKVKIIKEEEKKRGNLSHLLIPRCPQNSSNPGFVLLPSQRSAFLPLYKLSCTSDVLRDD